MRGSGRIEEEDSGVKKFGGLRGPAFTIGYYDV